MSLETLLYGWLPALIAFAALVVSALTSLRSHRPSHACLTLLVMVLVSWSLFTLYRIFSLDEQRVQTIVLFGREHWNRLPQLAILAAFLIALAQALHELRRRPRTS